MGSCAPQRALPWLFRRRCSAAACWVGRATTGVGLHPSPGVLLGAEPGARFARRGASGSAAPPPSVAAAPLAPGAAATLPSSLSAKGLSEEDRELLESLQAAVQALGEEAGADHPLVDVHDRVLAACRDKAALLKRDWTDEMFQEGEDMNEERVAEIEASLAAGLGRSGLGLEDGGNLGGALDLVGVYMKNYKLDKADTVLFRCAPHVAARGGVWAVKWLNHVSTVRMKQGRHLEALEMLYDLELYSPYSAEEAPEFFETLNRNLAWAMKSLGRIDDALVYFERMADASKRHKGSYDWFDCWDIGKLAATRAYRDSDMPAFYRGRAMIEEALRMHMESEPEDLVMRAKVHDSLAECFLVVEEFAEAERHYAAAYDLLLRTVGRHSPLFGKQARHAANLQLARGRHAEALPFLGEALAVESAKDSLRVAEAAELVDQLVAAQQRCPGAALQGLASNHAALKALQRNLRARGLDDSKEYGVLCHKMSLLYLHEHAHDGAAMRRALRLAKASVRVLRRCADDANSADWLRMAELHLRMLVSVRRGSPPGSAQAAGSADAAG